MVTLLYKGVTSGSGQISTFLKRICKSPKHKSIIMKVCVALLVLLPLAFAAPQKKFVLDSVLSLLDTSQLVQDLQTMVDVLGSDPTEQACEQECHKLAQQTLVDTACPLICHSFQELLHRFRVVPDNSVTPKTY